MKELGIYIHIPFCKQKCSYCDFTSFANKENFIKDYIEALLKEIKNASYINYSECAVDTIYIGGGTPSFIDSTYIKQILETVNNKFQVKEDAEVTIEVNPGTVNKKKLQDYINCGINRLSIGLQSTNDNLLKQIGRVHDYEEFLNTYSLAKEVGFKNINIDLMLGLPNQTLKDLIESINNVLELEPQHISIYSLILEEGTLMNKLAQEGKISLPDEEVERKMYWETKNILEKNDYIHYEISNFAKEGCQSKHNCNCWNQKEYLGFGLAAHSYYNKKRFCNTKDIQRYIKNINAGNIKDNIEILEIQNKLMEEKEYMFLGLRKIEGVNIQDFKNKFAENPIYLFKNEIDKLYKKQLLEVELDKIKLTNKGLDLANIVWEEFI